MRGASMPRTSIVVIDVVRVKVGIGVDLAALARKTMAIVSAIAATLHEGQAVARRRRDRGAPPRALSSTMARPLFHRIGPGPWIRQNSQATNPISPIRKMRVVVIVVVIVTVRVCDRTALTIRMFVAGRGVPNRMDRGVCQHRRTSKITQLLARYVRARAHEATSAIEAIAAATVVGVIRGAIVVLLTHAARLPRQMATRTAMTRPPANPLG